MVPECTWLNAGELHLSAVAGALQFRPMQPHIDIAEARLSSVKRGNLRCCQV
jgi:hypothetical protein